MITAILQSQIQTLKIKISHLLKSFIKLLLNQIHLDQNCNIVHLDQNFKILHHQNLIHLFIELHKNYQQKMNNNL